MKTRSTRSYQRELKQPRELIAEMQWVQPMYNGNQSCAGCGMQRHNGCESDCPAARITGDMGGFA